MINKGRKYNTIISYRVLLIGITLVFTLGTINVFSIDHFDNAKTIVFLGNERIAPIIYNEKGTAKGVVVDIAKELGKKIGYNIEVRAINWDEAQNMVLLGEADALLQINPNPEREKFYDFSDELLKSEFSIFTKSGNTSIENLDDLENKTVGVESGGYPFALLQKYDSINIEPISDWKTGFLRVATGEIDAIVVDRWIGEYELAQSRIKGIQVLDEPIETQYSRIAVKKGNKELLSLINSGLKEMNEDGTIAEILSNWQGKKVIYFTEESLKYTLLYLVIIFLAIILLVSSYFVIKFRKLSKKLESDVRQRTQELHDTNELLRKVNAELAKISMVDKLTAIYNRRFFDTAFQNIWEISKRERQPLALIMIDIDSFKLFNDTYGHLSGDQCLESVATAIKSVIRRPGDLVARFGGEEFIVLLLNTSEEGAAKVAENIRKKVENLEIKNEAVGSVITVSLGVAAVIPNDDMRPDELINGADIALYQAKKEGRNRVVRQSVLQA
ncbi:MAG TPA: diguanylate cyclase [Clostridia bacterium]|nr:diguanylate cyclase [Clostridia bacterium]